MEEKGERRKGVNGQSGKGNLDTMKKKKYIGKLWMNKNYYFCNRDTGLLLCVTVCTLSRYRSDDSTTRVTSVHLYITLILIPGRTTLGQEGCGKKTKKMPLTRRIHGLVVAALSSPATH